MSRSVGFALGAGLLLAACATPAPRSPPSSAQRVSAGAVWDDPARCHQAVSAGARLRRAQQRLRVATWNLDGFPFGGVGGRTDIAWLACTLAWLDAELIAVHGLALDGVGQRALVELVAALSGLSGGDWAYLADEGAASTRRRSLLLYRADRLQVTAGATHPWASGEAPGAAAPRPALGAFVIAASGGVDFHLVVVDLDAGCAAAARASRRRGWAGLAALARERQAMRPDDDLLLVGDLATAGCGFEGSPSSEAELLELGQLLRDASPRLQLVEQPTPCSAADRRGQLTGREQVIVAAAMDEAINASARGVGVCAAANCRAVPVEVTPSFVALSWHCPVVFDLLDDDRDP